MGVCPWSPLGGGVLSGKYSSADLGQPTDMGSRKAINQATGRLSEANLRIANVVSEVARDVGKTPAQIALAWTLLDPVVTSPVLGARTPAQLEDNLGALEVELGEEHLAKLDKASAVPQVFPYDVLNGPAEAMMFGGVKVERR
jgi:aryl-alcohol dehydrogenase-like predicted oxidoreductase